MNTNVDANANVRNLGEYTVEKTDAGAMLTAEDGRFCTFKWDEYHCLEWESGDLEIDDETFSQIPELVEMENAKKNLAALRSEKPVREVYL